MQRTLDFIRRNCCLYMKENTSRVSPEYNEEEGKASSQLTLTTVPTNALHAKMVFKSQNDWWG